MFDIDATVGIGIDLVHIPTFAEQFQTPGTRFELSFSPAERRLARRRAAATGQDFEHHLAARWAGKEAFIKAWSSVLVGQAPVLDPDGVDFAEIEVLTDAYGRPIVQLAGAVAEAFARSCPGLVVLVSLAHDGEYAMAQVALTAAGASRHGTGAESAVRPGAGAAGASRSSSDAPGHASPSSESLPASFEL